MVTGILICAGNRGREVYGQYALDNPNDFKIVAVAEPIKERRLEMQRLHNIPDDLAVSDWKELLGNGKIADSALICTMDREHFEPVKEFIKLGYHILCEKPMSNSIQECLEMEKLSKEYNKTITVCHVLRYSPFFTKIKEILDTKCIGEIANIQHLECVRFWHQAHSFVRGNWRNSEESAPMILAKSCHDMDILAWLIGKPCKKISSFGSLIHFKKENAPEGSAPYCYGGCKVIKSCPYFAGKIYLHDEKYYSNQFRRAVAIEGTKDKVLEALQHGPYGRCVYHCDNNVVDHQVVNMEFKGGATVGFTMSAFVYEGSRKIDIMGTHGQIIGDMISNTIEVKDYLTGNKTLYTVEIGNSGHSGSDGKFMDGFVKTIETNGEFQLSSASESVKSHLMAFAAEESRVTGKVIDFEEFSR